MQIQIQIQIHRKINNKSNLVLFRMQPLEKSLGILGISKTASLTELKAAYRSNTSSNTNTNTNKCKYKKMLGILKTASLTELKAAYRFPRFGICAFFFRKDPANKLLLRKSNKEGKSTEKCKGKA